MFKRLRRLLLRFIGIPSEAELRREAAKRRYLRWPTSPSPFTRVWVPFCLALTQPTSKILLGRRTLCSQLSEYDGLKLLGTRPLVGCSATIDLHEPFLNGTFYLSGVGARPSKARLQAANFIS